MTITERTAVADVLTSTWMISSDSHIIEPPDLWEGRMPAELVERGPRVVSEADFADWLAKTKASAARDDAKKVAAAHE